MKNKRILSIDILRGLVMVLMALDHVRDYFHLGAMTQNPMDVETSSLPLYFTRWITHYCAPIFVFLSGISAYLASQKRTKNENSIFLIKRGLFLILMEITVICFGWTFNPFFNTLVLQVIWAIGMSMITLGLFIYLPHRYISVFALLIIFGHNLLDIYENGKNQMGFLWDAFHHGGFSYYPITDSRGVMVIYPVLPWIGILLLGFSIGPIYNSTFDAHKRKRNLITMGSVAIVLFILLRYIDIYGDTGHWQRQSTFSKTLKDFLDVRKYPPSLIFTCMTIGPACMFLAFTEQLKNMISRVLTVYGKVPFFYYVLHIYWIHILCVIYFYASGHQNSEIVSQGSFFNFRPAEMGFSLPVTWLIWLAVVALLYLPCKWYDRFRAGKSHWIFKYI